MHKGVFLDRDGVINHMVTTAGGIDSPQHPDEFEIIAGVAESVRLFSSLGFRVAVVSNQPGIAKGKSSPDLLARTTERMRALLAADGARVDGVYYCLHHPQAALEEYRVACACRKPKPGLLLEAARELDIELDGSYMVGDMPTDVAAGRAAGCLTVMLSGAAAPSDPRPDYICPDLMDAARWIARRETAEVRG